MDVGFCVAFTFPVEERSGDFADDSVENNVFSEFEIELEDVAARAGEFEIELEDVAARAGE